MDRVGQTRAGRIGDPESHRAAPAPGGGDPRAFIEQTVGGSPAAVFSKLVCPSCRKAKEIMSSHLPQGQCAVVELDQRADGAAVQDVLEQLTGKHSVPSVWVGGQFVGGADALEQLERSGQLDQRLRAAGA